MVKSNEFKGATLREAVRKATFAYRRAPLFELKNQRRCNDLLFEMNHLSRQAGRYADEADRLQRDADALRREVREALAFAVIAVLSGLATALLRLKRVLRAIERMKRGQFSKEDLVELLSLIGPVASAAAGVVAATKFAEAEDLADAAEDLSARSERLGDEYMQAFNEYSRLGCGEDPSFTGI